MFMKYMKALSYSTALLLIAFLAGVAHADEFHYTNFLIGDRASGMGGAYTAVSDDVSGLFYNPAGAAYSQGRSLSASVNAYYSQNKKYKNVIGGNGWDRSSTALLPNFFGVIQPVGRYKIGLSYAVPDSIQENQDQTFNNLPSKFPGITATRYSILFKNEDNTYNIGPSISTEITKDWSTGLTLYYHERTHRQIMKQLISLDNGKYEETNNYYLLNERGVRPVLGFMWTPREKMSVGLSISRTLVFNSNTTTHDTYKDSNFDGNTLTVSDDGTDNKRKYPLQVRGGFAYFASNDLLFSIDGAWYSKVNGEGIDQRVSVFNMAAGAEYYYDKNLAFRAGLFSDLANTPNINADRWGQAEQIDIFGGCVSASHFSRNTSITLGGSASKGRGNAQLLAGQVDKQSVDVFSWSLFLSSSYSY